MRYVILLIVLLSLFCTNNSDIAGGTSTETTNGMVIISSNGNPANQAKVLIIDNNNWYNKILLGESPIIDTLESNSNGITPLDSIASNQTVQITYEDESAIIKEFKDTIVLSKGSRLTGSTKGNDKLYVGGTAFSATSQNNDSFYIDNVPYGTYSIYSELVNSLPLFSRIKLDTIQNTQIIENDTSLLFDDFLGGFDGNPLASVTSGFYWYTFSDFKNSHYTSDGWIYIDENGSGKSTATPQALDGKIRLDVFLDSSSSGSYAGLGARVFGANKEIGYNLSDMTGFRIKINGMGTVALFFKSVLIDSVNEELSDKVSHYHVKINLQGAPIDTTFQVSDLHMETEDTNFEQSYPWQECAKNIKVLQVNYRTLENEGNKNYWFELDEIRFIGVNLPL